MDIVERLRSGRTFGNATWPELCNEAAAEIERLRAELAARDKEIADWLRSGEADDIVCTHPAYLRDLADAIEAKEYRNTQKTV